LTTNNLQKITDLSQENSQFLTAFRALCRSEFGDDNFDKWLAHLEVFSSSESEIIFAAPSKFIRDWVIREFIQQKSNGKTLRDVATLISPKVKKVAIICVAKVEAEPSKIAQEPTAKLVNLSKHDNVFALGVELNPRYTFENFISAKYNKLAVTMAKIAAGVDEQKSFFDDKIPLFIHGEVGIGKTHLAQAIAWKIKDSDKSKKVVYLSAERFMYNFVKSVRSNDVMSFKEKMRSIDVLIVDDVQFIAGKESTQQEFMNCFNHLVEENKQVVLVCDRCPSNLENIDEKLKSRISGGMVVNFKTPNFQDRLTILKAKIQAKGQEISPEIVNLIADKVKTNIRDLEGVVNKIMAQKVLLEEEVTLECVKTILADYISPTSSSVVTIAKLQKTVAQFYGLKTSDLSSASRLRPIARARQIAMYLAKKLTQESLAKIAAEFGKNHATVIHSVRIVQQLIDSNPAILQEVKEIEEKL
jgi:chromosomal replication initiator protein